MKFKAYYLEPRGAMPIAVPSDTLAGAVLHAMARLYQEEAVEEAVSQTPFAFSSCFPYFFSEKGREHFLPKPLLPLTGVEPGHMDVIKKFKKARYLHQEVFLELTDGKPIQDILTGLKDDTYLQKSDFLYSKDLKTGKKFAPEVGVSLLPGNVLNRKTGRSENFFHTPARYFWGSGLYFLASFKDKNWQEKVEACLRLLEDGGLGGDISSGRGAFRLETGELELETHGSYFTNLSLYQPTKDELSFFERNSCFWYNLVNRGGRSRDGTLKKRVLLFGEGSVFPVPNLDFPGEKKFYGRVEKVREKAVEWGLTIPVKLEAVG